MSRIAGQVEAGSGKVKEQADLVSRPPRMTGESVLQMITALSEATPTMNPRRTLAEQSNTSAEQATATSTPRSTP